jgi:hypothetical protein
VADDVSGGALVSTAQTNFGRRLREHRERLEITLDQIVTATKIKRSVLAGLERGDVSGWPNGIFRRAFVREYATAVGLASESVLAEFVELFPDPGVVNDSASAATPPTSLRLMLAVDRRELMAARLTRTAAAFGEAALIAGAAALIAWTTATSFWLLCGTIALMYYTLATAFFGRSPASWFLHGGARALFYRRPAASPMIPDTRDLLYLVKRSEEPLEMTAPVESAETASAPSLRAAAR